MMYVDMSTTADLGLVAEREPTEVISRYLEAIYYMRAEGESVRSARLADWLGVSRPTVTVALRRMTRDGMVSLDGRKEIDLTERGQEAAAEFQKVLDHRGIVLADPIGAVAHLQLGRALVLLGEKDKARSAYQDFLTLWKDADPDIPVLKQACAAW